ncbi:MAG: beta-lactamase family protein [Sandaracinaceae bacterium]|nr:beta-lactamase family protein [Sandaracinaceae bacterium]
MSRPLEHPAPAPVHGSYAHGFGPLARQFARHFEHGKEVGAGLTVFHRGELVVDVWGGYADAASKRPWERDTRVVLFSVTKGFMAMAMHLLADRGRLDWDAPVATYWPGFAKNGKAGITVRALLNHQAGLPYLDEPLTLAQCTEPSGAAAVLHALEAQAPAWPSGTKQGYHAITYGLYARELFERIAGEPVGPFLRRELLDPLGSDVYLGAPPELDAKSATLYPPPTPGRLARMVVSSVWFPGSAEARIARAVLGKASLQRRAFLNPATGRAGVLAYNTPAVRRSALAWASATGSAHGVARAYLPFASGGSHGGRTYLKQETLTPVHRRQGWSERDAVLEKPLGWSQGFLKEERHVFSPTTQSFGHAGMGGALGWCDPVEELSFGYVMNRMDWRVRSLRVLGLCHALYECDPVREPS